MCVSNCHIVQPKHSQLLFVNYASMKVKVIQSCPTLCDAMDCSLPGSSVHMIPQARILEWVAVPFCRESLQTRVQTQVSHIVGRFFTSWATREAQYLNREKIVWLLYHSWMWLSRRGKWDIGTGYSGFPFKMSFFVCFWMYISYIWYF